MRPLKASLLFVYCLAAIAAVGTAVSHLWTTAKQYREDSFRRAANAPENEASAPAVPPAPAAAPSVAQPS